MEMKCENCKWWKDGRHSAEMAKDEARAGQCRLEPPLIDSGHKANLNLGALYYPHAKASDSCAGFEAKSD